MKVTNNHGLPDAIVSAIQSLQNDYDKGESTITVTQLIDPPQIVALKKQYDDQLTEDASDMLWSLMGSAMHLILERAETSALVEERLYMEVNGWTLGGKYDRLHVENKTLQDYKFSSVWEFIFGLKPERVAQLNILAELARRNGYQIDKLEVVMLFRDWRPNDAKHKDGYPQSQIARINVPVWTSQQCMDYINERVAIHQKAAAGDVPHCTDEERWANGSKWAVMKKGRKTALRVCDSEEQARSWMLDKGVAENDGVHYIEFRQGEYIRCNRYCPVASVCPQWAHDKE